MICIYVESSTITAHNMNVGLHQPLEARRRALKIAVAEAKPFTCSKLTAAEHWIRKYVTVFVIGYDSRQEWTGRSEMQCDLDLAISKRR